MPPGASYIAPGPQKQPEILNMCFKIESIKTTPVRRSREGVRTVSGLQGSFGYIGPWFLCGSLGYLRTLGPQGFLEPFGSLGSLRFLGSMGSVDALVTWVPPSWGSLHALGSLGSLGSLGFLGLLGVPWVPWVP